MIRKSTLFCKLIRIKTSSKSLFSAFMKVFHPQAEECPICHSKGSCHFHASYARNLIDFAFGTPIYSNITVTRVFCESCGHTHAILPDFIVPYATYGLFFILRVLAEYFARLSSVKRICQRFSLTPPMLYRWKSLFLSQKELWLGLLSSFETLPFTFLKYLCRLDSFSVFSSGFVRLTGFSFLQSHVNPAAASRQNYF